MVVDEEVENLCVLWPLCDQVAHRDDPIICLQVDQLDQITKLIEAAMNVPNDDRARHYSKRA